jgi:uncharacterized protein YggT (Ycf19 family)
MTGLAAFTLFHVILSLVGIVSGLVVLGGLFGSRRMDGWTALFLTTTIATSVTGFLFPFRGFTPAIGTGIISMVVLAVACYARYGRHLAGAWRPVYVATAVLALYLNVFVLVVQAFLKIPALKALAPQQNEPPFAVAQGIVLLLFVLLGSRAARRFRPSSSPAPAAS